MRTRFKSRVAWQVRWLARTPLREVLRYPEWLLQEFGLSGLFWRRTYEGGRIRHISPEFMAEHTVSLVDPPMIAAPQATHVRESDTVLGIEVDGDARAYPWWQMDDHHVVNDTVASCSVIVVLCEACSTAVAFDPVVHGRRLIFRVTHHYKGTVALGDDRTRSVWAPYLGMAIRGRMRGTRMEILPLVQTTWGAWRAAHPNTLVLRGDVGVRDGHGSSQSLGGGHIQAFSRYTISRWDQRLPKNELVLGVMTPRAQRAYPSAALRAADGVVNDVLGGVPIVVLFDMTPGSHAALAFDRRVDDRVLTFEARDGIRDTETGSEWTVDGRAVGGPLRGTRLGFVPSHTSEWFVWPAHYPDIDVWTPDGLMERAGNGATMADHASTPDLV